MTASAASNETFRVRLCLRRDDDGGGADGLGRKGEGLLFDVIPDER